MMQDTRGPDAQTPVRGAAVCLLSGGMDSYVAAAIAQRDGWRLFCLSVAYGQRHRRELESAQKVAQVLGADHRIVSLDLSWAKSSLTDLSAEVPDAETSGIPSTYVPARNTIFISLGLALAETIDADAIVVGVNAVDYSGYPDCRPEYLDAFQNLINLAAKKTVEGGSLVLLAPLARMSKAQIVRAGVSLGLDFSLTWSCYRNGERPCGRCPSCRLRRKGFAEAGIPDPLER